MADEIDFEYKTVRTVRGAEDVTISKMRKDGWELVSQSAGLLRSSVDFRRPKKRDSWLLAGAGVSVLAVVAVVGGLIAVFSDDNGDSASSPRVDAPVAAASTQPVPAATSAQPSAGAGKASATATTKTAAKVITPKNDPEFAALMKLADYCDEANLDFATSHAGQTVAFNGAIADMAPYQDYETRFDLLLRIGDKGAEATVGPAFKYENVSIRELKLTGRKIPAEVGEGDTFRFVARVREFNTAQCLFYLDPVATQVR